MRSKNARISKIWISEKNGRIYNIALLNDIVITDKTIIDEWNIYLLRPRLIPKLPIHMMWLEIL